MLTKLLRSAAAIKSKPIEFINFTSATANATSITLNKPTNTATGDLMVLVFQSQSSLAITLPSGWTTVVNAHSGTADLRTTILYKIAGAAEPSSYSVGISSARGIQGGIMTYRNASYSAFSGVSVLSNASTLNVSITPSSSNSVIIHYSGRQASSDLLSTPITGFTELFENYTTGSFSNSNLQISHVVPVGTTGTTGVSNTWSSAGGIAGAFIELVPLSPPIVKQASYITSVNTVSSSTIYTFNSTSIGAAASDRYIVLAVFGSGGASTTVSSVTVAGSSATSLVQINGNTTISALFIVPLETGTTADIVVAFPDAKERCAVSVWRVTGIPTITPYHTASFGTGNTVNTASLNINTIQDGIMIAAAVRGGTQSGTTTWIGATEAYDFTVSGRVLSGASLSNTITETGRLLQTNYTTSAATAAFVAVSF